MGKTTIGDILARWLRRPFFDLDANRETPHESDRGAQAPGERLVIRFERESHRMPW
ncbi:MAG: hypothetical protein JXO72_00290 [Vicinamibacteria bacterium]|nr:hypothetical protein [Vicinamibacteria bacterium]